MAEFDNKTREIVQRLQAIRVKMLREQPFYAVLLMHLRFALDEATPTLYTDGERIAFNPYFVDELDDFQLQFVLMHEILHVALGHCTSEEKDFNHKAYNIACDIVVNSNIMYSLGLIKEKVDIWGGKTTGYEVKKEVEIAGEPLIHKTPDGREGVELDAKEVYALLLEEYPELRNKDETLDSNEDDNEDKTKKNDKKVGNDDNNENSSKDNDDHDECNEDQDTDDGDDENGDSNGDEENSNNGGDNDAGAGKNKTSGAKGKRQQLNTTGFDDHSFWDVSSDSNGEQLEENQIWTSRMVEATEIAEKINEEYLSIKEAHKGFGGPPLGAKRLLKEILEPQTDWRTILENFIQEEINDYSFSPPDRRFEDSPFFLPDFNEKETYVKNIVFLIDTSGSISDSMIQRAYSEIKGAVDQLGNKFEGYIVFCDHLTYDLQPFCEETDLSKIIPKGGGGNDFEGNIRDVLDAMKDEPPECMIFITDGYDAFPDESVTKGIPFLWLITNTDVEPPWGKVARLTTED